MSIAIDHAELRSCATTYQRACEEIARFKADIDRTNANMSGYWKGGAFDGYMATYNDVVCPAIDAMEKGMSTCCENLNNYANVVEERDAADDRAFRQV